MAFQEVINTVQIEVRMELHGEPYENTFFYQRATEPTQAELQALVNDLGDYVVSDWLQLVGDEMVGNSVYGRGLTYAEDIQAISLAPSGVAGAYTSATEAGSVCIAIKRTAGLTGRSTRGRIYFGGIPEVKQSGNTLDPTYGLDVVEMIEGFDAVAIALSWTPVIVSRFNAGIVRPSGVTYPIVTWQLDNFDIDSQRRRLAGRG